MLRHKQPGAAESASKKGRFARIINAGDGNNEHPTQALIDLFTVDQLAEEIGRELHVTFVGDLQDSRTVRSLAILLARLKKESIGRASVLHFVAPKELQVSDRVLATLRAHEMPYEEHSMLTPELAAQSDVVYMTRLQTERKNGGISLEHLSGKSYRLEIPLVQQMPPHARILHPLPRNEEIPEEVDGDKRAWYFPQAENGRFIRMALLKLMLAP